MTIKLTVPAIRSRAVKFSNEFKGVTSEKSQDQNFMRGFVHAFGIDPKRLEWQTSLRKGSGRLGFSDGLLPGELLFEMKSAGEDLREAYQQAIQYIKGMADWQLPKWVIVSDFANIHAYDRQTGECTAFLLSEFSTKGVDCLTELAGYEKKAIANENEANEKAAEKIGMLHDKMKASGCLGRDLETYLVRLLFCLFADDTGLFGENGRFLLLLENTHIDGHTLHGELVYLFDTLNRPLTDRKHLKERFQGFPYVNGELFAGAFDRPFEFDEESRALLLGLARDDWKRIKPSIFGSLFQAIMHHDDEAASSKTKKRRELGAHYTSEENILKVINPLFMDELRAEFVAARGNREKLHAFQMKLSRLQFFDPACGCGNFLVVAYRELRLLEVDVIQKLYGGSRNLSNVEMLSNVYVSQFHGIEIDSTAARIATVAMWLTDHQMNLYLGNLGDYFHRLPLTHRPNIVCANALAIDWAGVLPPKDGCYVMGNPPFLGFTYQSAAQKQDMATVFKGVAGAGVLDYVSAWYWKAAQYIQPAPTVPVAFVSTNSITQGEQVAPLWRLLLQDGAGYCGVQIRFAHRTFRWSNEGRGVAAVHCVIVGFGLTAATPPRLFEYADIHAEAKEIKATQINPYLVDAPVVLIDKRRKPMQAWVQEMASGGKPTEGGNLLFDAAEAEHIRATDPVAAKYIRPYLMGDEFLNNIPRFCLWLKAATSVDRATSPVIKQRTAAVRAMREASSKEATRKLADSPHLFGEIRQPTSANYLAIPKVSSERRAFIPIGFLNRQTICGDKIFFINNAGLYELGVLSSTMHNAWMRTVCGRLKSDYSYSNTVVYNNYPWPESLPDKQRIAIEKAAQVVLDARELEMARCANLAQACSLAMLYNPESMPAGLLKAHRTLDKAVDAAYGYQGGKDDASRVTWLFRFYQACVAALPEAGAIADAKPKRRAANKSAVSDGEEPESKVIVD